MPGMPMSLLSSTMQGDTAAAAGFHPTRPLVPASSQLCALLPHNFVPPEQAAYDG